MTDLMTPIPFAQLMRWILAERQAGSVLACTGRFSPRPASSCPCLASGSRRPLAPPPARTRSWRRT